MASQDEMSSYVAQAMSRLLDGSGIMGTCHGSLGKVNPMPFTTTSWIWLEFFATFCDAIKELH